MKIGDKLYCKKELNDVDDDYEHFHFEIGKIYNIIEPKYGKVVNNGVFVDEGVGYWFYKGDKHTTIVNKLSDYFYTKKELRKIKLNEIGIKNRRQVIL